MTFSVTDGELWDEETININLIMIDNDSDGIPNLCDNCVNNYNPAQGDIDGDTIGDVCDTADADFERYFFADFRDTNDANYDHLIGGGPCNQPGGCEYSDQTTDKAYCNHSNWPNVCVYEGSCYVGDGTAIVDIDGAGKHEAMCVGFGWWDLDSGGEAGPTPLPGMEVCEMADYTWTTAESTSVGEYQWNYIGYGCCGDDEGEYVDGGICKQAAAKPTPPGKKAPASELR